MTSCAPISDPTACPSSGLKYGPIHSFGFSMTPSSELNRPATIFRMMVSFGVGSYCAGSCLLLTLRTGTGRMDTAAEILFPEV